MIALLILLLDPILHALGLAQMGIDPHTAMPVVAEIERQIVELRRG